MHGSVIFHSPGDLQASAAVRGWWTKPLAKLLIKAGAAGGFGNDVHDSCAAFVGWCHSQSPSPGSFAVYSLPGLPWSGSDHDPWDWYERLMAEVAGWDPPPLLVDLDEFQITQRGKVLWPSPKRRPEPRVDRPARLPGEPFPVGWVGGELGGLRPGRGGLNCYSPDELPQIRVPLTGTFGWLRTAAAGNRPAYIDHEKRSRQFRQLHAASADLLPEDFVRFFRSKSLWTKYASLTGWSLYPDPVAVPIRGGLGHLVTFAADGQGCRTWSLYISPDHSKHGVVATYFYHGSQFAQLPGGLPHPKDIVMCAASFEEFLYRFWLEGAIQSALLSPQLAQAVESGGIVLDAALEHALLGQCEMPEGGDEYLEFYRRRGPGA